MNTLTPKEVAVLQMAIKGMIEDLEDAAKNPSFPFTPQARKEMSEMILHSKSALIKIQNASGHALKMEPYKTGDEIEFLTKES